MYELVIEKMKECVECGTKLSILEGYRHPTMGKKHHLCSSCFDEVSDSVTRWGEFVQTNSFNVANSKKNLQMKWKNIIPSGIEIREMINNIGSEKLISTEK